MSVPITRADEQAEHVGESAEGRAEVVDLAAEQARRGEQLPIGFGDLAEADAGQPVKPKRRGRSASSKRAAAPAADDVTTEGDPRPVTVIGDAEADRLARVQGRIATKDGGFLRPDTDRGAAERVMDAHAGQLAYVSDLGIWRAYNGKYWADSVADRELHKMVGAVLRNIYSEVALCKTAEDAKRIRAFAKNSEHVARINAAKTLVTSECATGSAEFDRRAGNDTLNVANGTLDLTTYELRPHRPADMLAKFSRVTYAPDATAPNWLAHLEWSIPNAETRETVQRYFGYCLTTETREQKMLAFHGNKGRNGKGVILRAVEAVLGYDEKEPETAKHSYSQTAAPSLLLSMGVQSGGHNADVVDLQGKRLVSISESGPNQKFNEVQLKGLTGGDAMVARPPYGRHNIRFTPVAKYLLVTNNRPEVHGDDSAIWRRLFLVDFPNSIDDAGMDADPDYERRIQAELSGILNWMLDGLRKWRTEGTLLISSAIRDDTAIYRAEQDIFGQFVGECIEPACSVLVKKKTAYAVYRDWAQQNGHKSVAAQKFAERLAAKVPGFYGKRDGKPIRTGNPIEEYYGGFRLAGDLARTMAFDPAARGAQGNAIERDDPGEPPAAHLAYHATPAEQTEAAPAPEQQTLPVPPPEPAAPAEVTGYVSAHCKMGDRHDKCTADRAARKPYAVSCSCPCHDPCPEGDQEPTAPAGPVVAELAADEADLLAELDAEQAAEPVAPEDDEPAEAAPVVLAAEAVPAAPVDESAPEPVDESAGLFSAWKIEPWTDKPTAYVDVTTGRGIGNDGEPFTMAAHGESVSLADFLAAVPEGVRYVILTGAMPDGGGLRVWGAGELPSGWTIDRLPDEDEERDRVTLRYRRPNRRLLGIYRAATWIGEAEADTTPETLAAAMDALRDGIRATFPLVCTDQSGVPIKSTPSATALELVRRTLPRDTKAKQPHRFPILGEPMQRLIREHGGQARIEAFACITHHHRGALVPDTIPGLFVYDMKFAYAALFDIELPCGPVEHDRIPEFAYRNEAKRSGWIPCWYRVQVTVPQDWDAPGRFRTRDESGRWYYPDTPGETFTAYAWDRSLYYADRDGWNIGEHVQILDRFRFTGPVSIKPLERFGRAIRALREDWAPAQSDLSPQVRELVRVMARNMAIGAIGKLSGTPYKRPARCAIDRLDLRPEGAARSEDGRYWEWEEETPGRDYLVHPEWSAAIWATAQEWLYDHPSQPGAGLRHVPRAELIYAHTDGYWTSTPQPAVTDTGKVGKFRPQLAYMGELTTPRKQRDLQAMRDRLITEEGNR